jgi:TRAP-type C4-dicarboxylate transport system permease small subunit
MVFTIYRCISGMQSGFLYVGLFLYVFLNVVLMYILESGVDVVEK